MKTKLYKHDDRIFPIVNFLFINNNIPTGAAHIAYIK